MTLSVMDHDEEDAVIHAAWASYQCGMSDPWRNDFVEDGQAADTQRREELIYTIKERLPKLSYTEIEQRLEQLD
jgi:hypothetical protein